MSCTPVKKRDSAIELYRIVLMFLICLLHSFQFGISPNKYWCNALMWAVCGFVFISGWFGIRFSLSKWLRLLCLGFVCGSVSIAIAWLLDIQVTPKQMAYILARQWFLCAYLMLMLFAPILNMAFDTLRPSNCLGGGVMPSLIIITVWNWLGNLNPWHEFGPYTEGMGPYTFLMMISVYSLGRIIRIKSDRAGGITGVRTSKIAVASIVNLIILVCGWRLNLGMYCSPFAMSMAVLMFFLFKKVVVSPRLESLVLFIAPSMFSIYLLHAHIVGAVCIKRVQHIFVENGVSPCLFIPLTAVIVFVICFAIDLPRRSLMCRIEKKLFTVLDCHDKKFESVITRLVNGQSIG